MLNTQTWAIAGFILSALGNIVQFLSYRRIREQKIEMARKEILDSLRGPILEKAYPQKTVIVDLINSISRKYKLKAKKHFKVDEIKEEIIRILYEQVALGSAERNELIQSFKEIVEASPEKREEAKIIPESQPTKAVPTDKSIKVLFSDNFEEFKGWKNYEAGRVVQSSEYVHEGNFSLKKVIGGDPYGGRRQMGVQLELNKSSYIVFSGWIYRPPIASPNLGDRLSLEDGQGRGYGFCVNHSSDTAWIERRDNTKPAIISQIVKIEPIVDRWYRFEFRMHRGGKFGLTIFYDPGKIYLESFIDRNYLLFTHVAVRGGFPYHVDNIEVKAY